MEAPLKWINENREWLFSGIGVFIIGALWALLVRRKKQPTADVQQSLRARDASDNIQVGRDFNITLGAHDQSASLSTLRDLDRSMGDLFSALRDWLREHPFAHEFNVVSSQGVVLWTQSQVRFRFNADETPDLISKVRILEDHGFVRDVTTANVPMYRMSPDFVAYLTATR